MIAQKITVETTKLNSDWYNQGGMFLVVEFEEARLFVKEYLKKNHGLTIVDQDGNVLPSERGVMSRLRRFMKTPRMFTELVISLYGLTDPHKIIIAGFGGEVFSLQAVTSTKKASNPV